MGEWIEIGAKDVAYAGVLLTFGCAVAELVLLPRTASSEPQVLAASSRLRSVQLVGAGALLGALLLRAFGHTVAAFDLPDALQFENLRIIALESRWGEAWRQQMVAAALLFGGTIWARLDPGRFPALAVAALALLVSVELTRTGHAASQPWGWLLHGTHLAAAGAWAGTLASVLLLSTPTTSALRPALLRAFAPVAMLSVAVLAGTGLVATWRYLGPWSNLWMTTYGLTLLVKVAVVADMLVLGAVNWRRLHAGDSSAAVPPTAWIEIAMAVVVVMATGLLSETEHP